MNFALIAGVTGIVGNNLARTLLDDGWRVEGLARREANLPEGIRFLAADLLDVESVRGASGFQADACVSDDVATATNRGREYSR